MELWSQTLDKIGKADALKLGGSVSLNSYLKPQPGKANPLTYIASGNLNLSLWDFAVPISFSYSNQRFNYTQPFNRLSLHPKYKKWQFHIGSASLSFSKYTMSGYLFNGAAIETTLYKKLKIKTFVGNMKKAQPYDTTLSTPASYGRTGYGLHADWTHDKIALALSIFSASDNPSSIQPPDTFSITPQSNLATGFKVRYSFIPSLTLTTEIGLSLVTRDALLNDTTGTYHGWYFRFNNSTEKYWAGKTDLTFSQGTFSMGVTIEQVAQGYTTFGSYSVTSDFRNLSLNLSQSLFQNKLTVSASIGREQNNLSGTGEDATTRNVYALNIAATLSEKLSLALSYSSFLSTTYIKNPFDDINAIHPEELPDTLSFSQISHTGTASINYQIQSDKDINSGLSLSGNYARTYGNRAGLRENLTDLYSSNVGYNYAKKSSALTIQAALTSNYSVNPQGNNLTIGPTFSLSKGFLGNSLKPLLSLSYNLSATNATTESQTAGLRLTMGYVLKKKHRFSLGMVGRWQRLQRRMQTKTTFNLTFSYRYSFSILGTKKG